MSRRRTTASTRASEDHEPPASGETSTEPREWYVYVLLCSDDSLYCGITNDVTKRLDKHEKGKGSKYVRSRRPVKGILMVSLPVTKSEALKREAAFKKLRTFEKKMEAVVAMEQERRDQLMKNDGFVALAAKQLNIPYSEVTWEQREKVRLAAMGTPYQLSKESLDKL